MRVRVDIGPYGWDKQGVNEMKKTIEKKTPGTLIVEKYRPQMNKLTPSQRQQLRDRAIRIAFGPESESTPDPRR